MHQRESIVVSVGYKMWDDYYTDASGNKVLKNGVKPHHYQIGTKAFKTIEEMFIYIELTFGNDIDIAVDCEDNVANEIIKLWYEHQCR